MSNSVRPHRWQPTRLLCPQDSLGKNTGVGCHFLLLRALQTSAFGDFKREEHFKEEHSVWGEELQNFVKSMSVEEGMRSTLLLKDSVEQIMILLHFILRNECKPLRFFQEATEIKGLVILEPKVCVGQSGYMPLKSQ